MKTLPSSHAVRSAAFAIAPGLLLGLATASRAELGWERNFSQRYDREPWYQPQEWFEPNTDTRAPEIPPRTTHDTRGVPTVASSRITPFYYYWDPEIVGWSTAIPMTGRDERAVMDGSRDRLAEADGTVPAIQLQGRIDDIRWISLYTPDGEQERHSFIRVRLEDGESRMVSLGTHGEPEDLELRRGQDIDVTGFTARVDDRQIVIADRIEVRDELVTLVGRVADFREVNLTGTRDRNLVVRMDLVNGERTLVDLGPGTTLDDLNLEKGDRIQLDGVRQEIAGRPVIVATRIRVEGERTEPGEDAWQATRCERGPLTYTTRPPAPVPPEEVEPLER